jgi:hypothetical protein
MGADRQEMICQRAHEIWENEGRPGRGIANSYDRC